ncbi:MAG: 30S ribosomal protein S1 [Candidatus Omnitrophica bacterium]|nr:30S ribosomal protein S1 [Candidatus Omnitrophota bacterium]
MSKEDQLPEELEQVSQEDQELDEELAALYEESMNDLDEGAVVKGKILSVSKGEVVVDVGYKSEGVIPLHEFNNAPVAVGDEIDVLVEVCEDEDGMVVLSRQKAERTLGWERFISNYEEGELIQGRVTRKVKGGLMVDIGIEAFLPASLTSTKGYPDLNRMVSQTYKFKIIKVNRSRKNVVLSRREVLMAEREEARGKLLVDLEVGQIREGVVKNITDFGAFIDLGGGVDGLLHITDMGWGRLNHPSEVVSVGDSINVKILDFDQENMKISLGLKQTIPSPWENVETKYNVGDQVAGKVVNLMPYGAFVELEKGIEGLVHVSELSWTRRVEHPNQVLTVGDQITVVVLNVDQDKQKVALGYKQTQANPWAAAQAAYPVGSKVKGKVRHFVEYGAFVELDDDLEGLIHISDMSWTRKVNHPAEILKKGQEVDVVILTVDADQQKIGLGLKQLITDPWSRILEEYPIGKEVDGHITKITNFGLFVELEQDVEGLVHVSELPEKPQGSLEDVFKDHVGKEVRVRVIKVDNDKRQVGLSMMDLDQPHDFKAIIAASAAAALEKAQEGSDEPDSVEAVDGGDSDGDSQAKAQEEPKASTETEPDKTKE